MKHGLRSLTVSGTAVVVLAGLGSAAPALAGVSSSGQPGPPAVVHVGQIDRQDIASRGNCEPDTLAEPDVAVSPFNANIQIAVAHDCRFASGGAVDISYAWTHDGGAHWHHAPMPGLTTATGGTYPRASDPVVAFGPDGSVYVSALVFNTGCASGVAVSRSTDGGATFGRPVLAHASTTCKVSDDKNWLVVDTQPHSPFYGRIYQFWTEFLAGAGSPQVVRWSDDHGKHWSATRVLGSPKENAQDSQPVIEPDGAITDVYEYFGVQKVTGDTPMTARPAGQAASSSGIDLVARTSADGGARWSARSVVATNVGGGPRGIRCCLALVSGNHATGQMYAVWNANGPGTADPVLLSASADGQHWTAPVHVTPARGGRVQYINAAVAAEGRRVFVSFGSIDTTRLGGNIVQQELTWSADEGASFATPIGLGPPSNLKYAAVAGGKFPGDYTGLSATESRVTTAWCVSSRPPKPGAVYHQTLYAAVLRP